MSRYVALVRGINVGGRNSVPMPALRAMFESLGHERVTTYIQSGNVCFTTAMELPAPVELATEIECGILATFGLDVRVTLRARADLVRLAGVNPFLDIEADHAKLHVVFLAATPTSEAIGLLDPSRFAPDVFAVVGREMFIRYPNGAGQSRLTLDYIERRLGTHGTARNWNTVNHLLARLDG